MKVRMLLLLLSSGVAASHCDAQKIVLPTDWVETSIPSNKEYRCANGSPNEWRVSMVSGTLDISDTGRTRPGSPLPPQFVRTKEMRGNQTVVQTEDGWLIGFDAGEFGGGLWWSNQSGSETRRLGDKNVEGMIARGKEILILTGLAHMDSDSGELYSYHPSRQNEPGEVERLVELGSQPTAAVMADNGTLFIATVTSVLTFSPANQLRTAYHSGLFLLYPNSLVVDRDGLVLIGMRFYLLRLQAESGGTYKATWFKRSVCSETKMDQYRCVCMAEDEK